MPHPTKNCGPTLRRTRHFGFLAAGLTPLVAGESLYIIRTPSSEISLRVFLSHVRAAHGHAMVFAVTFRADEVLVGRRLRREDVFVVFVLDDLLFRMAGHAEAVDVAMGEHYVRRSEAVFVAAVFFRLAVAFRSPRPRSGGCASISPSRSSYGTRDSRSCRPARLSIWRPSPWRHPSFHRRPSQRSTRRPWTATQRPAACGIFRGAFWRCRVAGGTWRGNGRKHRQRRNAGRQRHGEREELTLAHQTYSHSLSQW